MIIEVRNGDLHKALSVWKSRLKDENFYEEFQKHKYYRKKSEVNRESRKLSIRRSKWKLEKK